MGTKANIGIIDSNGQIRRIYCHYDGYPAWTGRILAENYNTTEKVEALISLGNLSTLDTTLETCSAYHRDRGEPLEIMKGYAFRAEVDYVYLWDPSRNEWRSPYKQGAWVYATPHFEEFVAAIKAAQAASTS